MFKSVRWRSDRNKIAAVFKLRFHASQAPELGLVLSLVLAETGRTVAKLEKCEIRDGCCYWESSVLETVKFVQDPKSGRIHDRLYSCVVSTGSTKSSVLGEISVNFAEYAGAIKPALVSLQLKGSNSDVVLHVLIQRVQENDDQREVEEHKGAKINHEDGNLNRNFGNGGIEEALSVDSIEEEHLRRTVSNIELNANRSVSLESDTTLSSSDSSSELNTPRDIGIRINSMVLDLAAPNQQRTQWELSVVSGHDSSTYDSTNSSTEAFHSGRPQLVLDLSVEKLKSYLVLISRKAEVADLELQTLRKQIVKERKRGQELLEEVAQLKLERNDLSKECEKFKVSQIGEADMKAINKSWDLLEETRHKLKNEKDQNIDLQLQLGKMQESNLELTHSVQGLQKMLEQSRRKYLYPSAKEVFGKAHNDMDERCPEVAEGQCQSDDDDEEQRALEEIVMQHTDAKENYILEQKLMDLSSEIEMYRRDKDELEMQMEQLALDYEILKQENHGMSYKQGQSHLQEQLKLEYECSGSYATANGIIIRVKELERELKEQSNELVDSLATIKQLENHVHALELKLEKQALEFKDESEVIARGIVEKEQQATNTDEAVGLAMPEPEDRIEKLKGDLMEKSKQHSDALAEIKELEDKIQSLAEELDNQTREFEYDLEALTHAKVEQEQRAIRAEETLRHTRWKNANTAERIQDEFERLAMQMHSTFEANEKVATKAMAEASDLQLKNSRLEELVQHTKEELQSLKDGYEAQVDDLNDQLTLQSRQIDELLSQLSHEKEHKDVICQGEDLQAELGEVNTLPEGRDLSFQREIMDRENLESSLSSVNKESDKSLESLNCERCSKNERDMSLLYQQTEVNTLEAHCEELRHSSYIDELKKEKQTQQAFLLEAELNKEDALTSVKDNNVQGAPAAGSEDATSLKEKINMLEILVKQKDIALETIANAFSEKEKDLHSKIEELENKSNKFHRITTYEHQKVHNGDVETFVSSVESNKLVDSLVETSSDRVTENGMSLSTSTTNSGDEYELCVLRKEMTLLPEHNKSMENEPKEMQERYSEMSVNFAAVKGMKI